jgi:hypothetical protein
MPGRDDPVSSQRKDLTIGVVGQYEWCRGSSRAGAKLEALQPELLEVKNEYAVGRIGAAGLSLLGVVGVAVGLTCCAGHETAYGARKVLVCHKGKTLVVPETVVSSRLADGDTRGACRQ